MNCSSTTALHSWHQNHLPHRLYSIPFNKTY